MKKKFMIGLFLCLILSYGFTSGQQDGGTGAAKEKHVEITMATGDAIGSLRNLMGKELQKEIESHPELNISINHIEGPVLGSANQIMDQVIEGSVQIFGNDLVWFVPYDKDLQPTSFGFAFRDEKHLQDYLDSDMFQEIIDRIAAKNGLRLVSSVSLASRLIFSVKPLNQASDLVGLKMRAPGLEMFIESYKAYGMSPTTVAWNEIFLALKTGVAEAAQGPAADVIANKWHLAAPNITRLGDMFAVNGWYVNDRFWQSLSDNQKKGMTEAFKKVDQWAYDQAMQNESQIIDQMVQEGAVYNNNFLDREVVREKALNAARRLESSGRWSAGVLDSIEKIQ